ncbi:MAG: hypothetical protein D6767_05590 [Candidatus Hydrogenedentota bacterium]|nr:MAG: hypothetical protein D6767_05590 [Candidatus Hydrogenedentota bacterium]
MKRVLIISIFVWYAPLFASFTSTAPIMTLPSNAYELSRGHSAKLTGVEAMAINPAATAEPYPGYHYSWDGLVTYQKLPASISYLNASFVYQVSPTVGTFGISFAHLNYGRFDGVDANGISTGSISAYEIMGILNYARPLFGRWTIGGNVRLLYDKLDQVTATGVGFDAGMKGQMLVMRNFLWLSVSGTGFGPGIKFERQASPLPAKFNAALTYELKSFLPKWMNFSFGPSGEYWLEKILVVGGGAKLSLYFGRFKWFLMGRYLSGLALNGIAFGTGVAQEMPSFTWKIDGSYQPMGILGNNIMISARFSKPFGSIGPKKLAPVNKPLLLEDPLAENPLDESTLNERGEKIVKAHKHKKHKKHKKRRKK